MITELKPVSLCSGRNTKVYCHLKKSRNHVCSSFKICSALYFSWHLFHKNSTMKYNVCMHYHRWNPKYRYPGFLVILQQHNQVFSGFVTLGCSPSARPLSPSVLLS